MNPLSRTRSSFDDDILSNYLDPMNSTCLPNTGACNIGDGIVKTNYDDDDGVFSEDDLSSNAERFERLSAAQRSRRSKVKDFRRYPASVSKYNSPKKTSNSLYESHDGVASDTAVRREKRRSSRSLEKQARRLSCSSTKSSQSNRHSHVHVPTSITDATGSRTSGGNIHAKSPTSPIQPDDTVSVLLDLDGMGNDCTTPKAGSLSKSLRKEGNREIRQSVPQKRPSFLESWYRTWTYDSQPKCSGIRDTGSASRITDPATDPSYIYTGSENVVRATKDQSHVGTASENIVATTTTSKSEQSYDSEQQRSQTYIVMGLHNSNPSSISHEDSGKEGVTTTTRSRSARAVTTGLSKYFCNDVNIQETTSVSSDKIKTIKTPQVKYTNTIDDNIELRISSKETSANNSTSTANITSAGRRRKEDPPEIMITSSDPNYLSKFIQNSVPKLYKLFKNPSPSSKDDDDEEVGPQPLSQPQLRSLDQQELDQQQEKKLEQNQNHRGRRYRKQIIAENKEGSVQSNSDSLSDRSGCSKFIRSTIKWTIYHVWMFLTLCSLLLLLFSVIIVMTATFTKQTLGTNANYINKDPALMFILFWFMVFWLAIMEGGQSALVGLYSVDNSLYCRSHPKAYKSSEWAHSGDNLLRFCIGRQCLVVVVIFVLNILGSTIDDASVLGLPPIVNEVFLRSGFAMMVIIIMIGQLTSQLTGINCMIDFINNYLMLITTFVSLVIEKLGVMHALYLIQLMHSLYTGQPIQTNEPKRNCFQWTFTWIRLSMSLVLVSVALSVTLTSLVQQPITFLEELNIPPPATVVGFIVILIFMGILEGLQSALFSAMDIQENKVREYPKAYRNCEVAFLDRNLQALLIGRQICVTVCLFGIARISFLSAILNGEEDNIFDYGTNGDVKLFINSSFLAALVTAIFASLCGRMTASLSPLGFLSNPIIYPLIHFCLLINMTGVGAGAYVLERWNTSLVGYEPDVIYLERASTSSDAEDDDEDDNNDDISNDNHSIV